MFSLKYCFDAMCVTSLVRLQQCGYFFEINGMVDDADDFYNNLL